MKSAHILVIEDSLDIQSLLSVLLKSEGYSVACAENGYEALRYLSQQEHRPDLILLDLMMPEMDGYQFRQIQLADPKLCAIPVVLMSADSTAAEIPGKIQVDGLLKKPFLSVQAILDAVECLTLAPKSHEKLREIGIGSIGESLKK